MTTTAGTPQWIAEPSLPARWRGRFAQLRFRLVPEGLVLFLILLVTASFLIQQISPWDPQSGTLTDRLKTPQLQALFWKGHPLGTDQQGRDIFVRVLVGARYSLAVAAIALGIAGAIGLVLGMIAGYFGGVIDILVMRAADFFLSVPIILLALILAGVFGPSLLLISISLAISLWAVYARMIRGETLSVTQRDFIRSARIAGASSPRIIAKHVLPHVLSTFIVLLSLQIGGAILAEASLSFLGAGIPAPLPAWGSMAAEGRRYVQTAWWLTVFPGVAIAVIVLCFSLLGDWLRDILDPRANA